MTAIQTSDQLRRLALIAAILAALAAGILWSGGQSSLSGGPAELGNGLSLDSGSGDVIARKGRPAKGKKS